MPIIKKPSKELFYDLLNDANPDADPDFAPDNVYVPDPTRITTGDVTNFNTKTKVVGIAGVYKGTVEVSYRRLDVAILTRGVSIRIRKKTPIKINQFVQVAFTLYDLLPDLNRIYGLHFTEDDFPDAKFTVTTQSRMIDGFHSSTLSCRVKATSLAYFGTIQVVWINALPSLADLLAGNKKILDGRMYPRSNDFPEDRRPIGEWMAYNIDISRGAARLGISEWKTTSGISVGSNSDLTRTIIRYLWKATGNRSWSSSICTNDYGLGGTVLTNVVLPNKLHPEANSSLFNRALIITPNKAQVDTCWFEGKIILHYNA